MMELTRAHAKKVLDVVDAGLVEGLGEPIPGKMCVEAAVCFALGLPHSDKPICVGSAVRSFKIRLNDAPWSSNVARTTGLRKLAIAQLGSDTIDQMQFTQILTKLTIQLLLPALFRELAAKPGVANRKESFLLAAENCEREGTRESAQAAQKAAAADDAYAAAGAAYAAYAAAGAAYAAYAAAAVKEDTYLFLMADIGLEALKMCESPGCRWLDLVEP